MMSPTTLLRLLPLLALLVLPAHAEDPAPAPAAEPTADEAAATAQPPATKVPDAEQRLAAELRSQIKDGEAITLKVAEKEVLALLMPQSRGKTEGAVLLLHDLNAHPDWPQVIRPLRRQLPDSGWHTLSLQLPLTDPALSELEQLDASRLRIAEALAELERRAIKNIVLIGHGQGALAAIDYLADNLAPAVQGLIVISLDGSANDEPRLDAARGLGQIKLPILDLYGERDHRAVTTSAQRRYDLARRSNDKGAEPRPAYADVARDYTEKKGLSLSYRQIKLSGADHQFTGQTRNLLKRLRGWLKRYAT